MHSHAKVLGQPLNPVLTMLPLGILSSAVFADLAALVSGVRLFGTLAHADMVPGLLAGVLALCALLVDLITATPGTMARQVLGVICVAFAAMVVAFTTVWSVRLDGRASGGLFAIEVLALAAGIAGAWLARGLTVGRGLPRRAPAPVYRPEPPPAVVAALSLQTLQLPLVRLSPPPPRSPV